MEQQVVLVTGASSGIGRETAILMAKTGHVVYGAARRLDKLQSLSRYGVIPLVLDVTKDYSCQNALQQILNQHGTLDILINNAGVSSMNRIENLTEKEWDFNFNVNIKGMFFVTQAVLPELKKTKGTIVNTASMASIKAAPLLAHYTASKFAVLGFTKTCALEFAEYGINVNCVCPGYVKTSMQEREVVWEGNLRGMTPQAVIEEYICPIPRAAIF